MANVIFRPQLFDSSGDGHDIGCIACAASDEIIMEVSSAATPEIEKELEMHFEASHHT